MSSKILIVDDEPSARQTLENLLFAEGYVMRFAESGVQGLAQAIEWQPDAILCDVMMPEMDGFQVCQRVRADPRIAQVPILLVTALNDRESKLRGLESGADDFLSKPFDFTELRARVRTTIRLNRYRQLVTERTRLMWVLEHSEDGYLITTAEDQIQFANARARLYLGLDDDSEMNSEIPFSTLASRQYQLEPAEAWTTWPSGSDQIPRYLVRPETATAQSFWLQAQILALPDSDTLGCVIRLHDVTTWVLAQQRWSSFAQTLSHKLRTPVGNVYSLMELLNSTATDMSKQEILEILPLGYAAAARLKTQLEDMLSYIEAPRLNATAGRFKLAELGALIAAVSKPMNLQVTQTVAPEASACVLPMATHTVETILWELLENAQKFHPQHAPHVEIKVTCEDAQTRIQICDDGITLSPEQLARAWVPFYQGEKYQTGEAIGSGLGLSAVALHVWNVGGACRLFNRDDQPGIVVELILPVFWNL
jgi:two-component system, cell cycle response regulator